MSKGNFKVRCTGTNFFTKEFLTPGKIYEFKNGVAEWDHFKSFSTYNSFQDFCNRNPDWGNVLDLVEDKKQIFITEHGKKVVATITDGDRKYRQHAKLSDHDGDFKRAAWAVFARLMNRFDVEEIEAVDAQININDSSAKSFFDTPAFDWEGFKAGKFAVHCDTEEKAREFLKECDEHGIKWSSGYKTTEKLFYEDYKERTCYSCYFMSTSKIGFARIGYFEEKGVPVIDYNPSKPIVKEVHRKAKVGEQIKVKAAFHLLSYRENPEYKNGDILLVDESDVACVRVKGIEEYIEHAEYDVLENYQPDDKPEAPQKTPLSEYSLKELADEIARRVEDDAR